MHAVELLNHLAGERDTDVDERRVIERRVRRRTGPPDSDERSEVSEPSSFGEDGGELEPVAAARLDEVRLKETIVRRTAPGPAQPTTASQYGDVPIAFEFVRSQDRSQRLALAAPDTLVIRAIATGSPAAMPRPTVLPLFAAGRERRPVTVSVAIEGLLFAVRVEAGDTAETTAHRLIDRLDRYYSVELLEAGEQEAVLRLAGLRVGAPT